MIEYSLPPGLTCGDCAWFEGCSAPEHGARRGSRKCLFRPRRFLLKGACIHEWEGVDGTRSRCHLCGLVLK